MERTAAVDQLAVHMETLRSMIRRMQNLVHQLAETKSTTQQPAVPVDLQIATMAAVSTRSDSVVISNKQNSSNVGVGERPKAPNLYGWPYLPALIAVS